MILNKKSKLNNYSTNQILFFIGILFLVILPKGGFKIAGIPITWGYIYLGLLSALLVLIIVNKTKFAININHLRCYLFTLPFVIYFIINISIRGYEGSLGNLISFFVSFVFMPFLFYILLGNFLSQIDSIYIEKTISIAILIVAVYGVILFFFKQITGTYIEIPYVTINAADVGELENKYNNRGSVFKLVSTYNNGNIFGVCILMLFPMFYKKNKSKLKLAIVILSLILTLSRTVWLGLFFYFLIINRNKIFKLLKIYFLVGATLLLLGSIAMTKYFQYGSLSNFVLDTNLGGRIAQIKKIDDITLFGSKIYTLIDEIVYLSIFNQLGIIGLMLFCLSFFLPVFIFRIENKHNFLYILGSFIYLFVCLSDGCILLIPTLVFFYFTTTMAFIVHNRS